MRAPRTDPGSWEYTSQVDTEALSTAASVERVATALERELHVYMRPCELFNLPFFSGLFLAHMHMRICSNIVSPGSPLSQSVSLLLEHSLQGCTPPLLWVLLLLACTPASFITRAQIFKDRYLF